MASKKKGLVIAALIIVILITALGLGFHIKKSRTGSSQKTKTETVRKLMGSVRQRKTIKKPIPKAPPRPTTKPAKKPATPPPGPSIAAKPKMEKTVDYEREMNRVNDLIKRNDKNADAFYNRGWLYDHKGKARLAEKDYTKAIKINKRHKDAYYNRGVVFVRMKKYRQAVKDFSEALRLEPGAVDAYCNRGSANFQMGKTDNALKDYNAALKINSEDADLYYNRAVVYDAKGEKAKSRTDFHKAAKLGHNEARQYLNLPPAKAKKSKTPVKTSQVSWGMDPSKVQIPVKRASGKIHGENFRVEKAKIEKGILTLRQGKQVFPDHAVMIFLFSKKGEKLEGKTYKIAKTQGLGVPPIHMKWKKEGSDIPETEIFMKDYAMHLEFGKKERDNLTGKIYLSLPDKLQSFVTGRFTAKIE